MGCFFSLARGRGGELWHRYVDDERARASRRGQGERAACGRAHHTNVAEGQRGADTAPARLARLWNRCMGQGERQGASGRLVGAFPLTVGDAAWMR